MEQIDDRQAAASVMPDGWRGILVHLRNFSFENWLYKSLSDHSWGKGNNFVPLHSKTLYVDDKGKRYRAEEVHSDTLTPRGKEFMSVISVFSFLNDSFELGIGWPNKWHCVLRREAIHTFIWWYLRNWVFGEWFGLRRWLWYKLLHRRVERGWKQGRLRRHLI